MSRPDLQGKTIVVTRPAHQAGPLCELIAAAGGRPLAFPLLAIAPPQAPARAEAILSRLADYRLAIFISPNAVSRAAPLIARAGGLPETLQLAAVGRGTARAVEQQLGRGIDLVPQERYDSEGLLTLPALQEVAGAHIVIVRGEGGRELLATTLRERGARVDYAEVYRRTCPDTDPALLHQAWQAGGIDLICLTSAEALDNLVQLVPAADQERLRATPLLVVGERMADHAVALGFAPPLTARRATDDELYTTMLAWSQD